MNMAVTKEDLRDFTRFAEAKLQNGETGTLVELVREWESQRRDKNSGVANCAIQVDPETLQGLAKAFPVEQDEELLRRALARRGGVTTAEMLGKAVLAAARTARE
jgi:hypothetical protein